MKKWVKILLVTFIGFIIAVAGVLGFSYYKYWGRFDDDKEKYPHYIGYIDQENAQLNNTHELCGDKHIAYTYNGAAFRAFTGTKKTFRNNILSSYQNRDYSDSGYLNFRFLVNCEGQAGWFEVIKMNLDLEETELNKAMVDQLLILTSNQKHWNKLNYKGTPLNYYMYVSYRIENGEITEILP